MLTDLDVLNGDGLIYLFSASKLGAVTFNFTAHTNVSFGGIAYSPIPCQISGFEISSEGALPRPTLSIADEFGFVRSLAEQYGGLEGWQVTVKMTKPRYLDNGATPNPQAASPTQRYIIGRKTSEIPGQVVSYELRAAIDFNQQKLPRRTIGRTCSWRYRGNECAYSGQGYTLNNQPTNDPAQDICGKSLSACETRNNSVNFGGAPAIGQA